MNRSVTPDNGAEKANPRAGNGGVVPPVEHRFKPGWEGGPGRPKERPFRDAMRKALKEGRHSLDAVIDDLFTEAAKGNVQAIREVRETLDGQAPQPHAGSDDEPPIKLDLSGLSTDAIKRILTDTESPDQE